MVGERGCGAIGNYGVSETMAPDLLFLNQQSRTCAILARGRETLADTECRRYSAPASGQRDKPRVRRFNPLCFRRNFSQRTVFLVTHVLYDAPDLTRVCVCKSIRVTELRLSARLQTMAVSSRSEILDSKPIGDGLSGVRNSFESLCKDQGIPASLFALDRIGTEGDSTWLCQCTLLTYS